MSKKHSGKDIVDKANMALLRDLNDMGKGYQEEMMVLAADALKTLVMMKDHDGLLEERLLSIEKAVVNVINENKFREIRILLLEREVAELKKDEKSN